MRRALLASVGLFALAIAAQPVAAADVSTARPVHKAPVVAPMFDWTGWYVGVNYGTGIAQTHGAGANTPGSFDRAGTGYSVGAQVGYNWQYHPNWVAGVEGDIGWLGIDRKFVDWGDNLFAFGVKTDWYGTIRGRLGYTSSPSLFYVTGGVAFVDVKNHFDFNVQSARSETATGWAAGGGIETMLGGNWSAKAEYLYIDAGSQDVFNSPDVTGSIRFNNRFHVFRKGLNYRFGGPGAPAGALPAHNWTGFYAGINAGTGASQVINVTTPGISNSLDIADTAFTGGAQAGYNWQFHPHWVGGIEGDIGWLGIDRTLRNWNSSDSVFGVETDWYATVRGRFGRSTGPALLYVTGGAAFVKVKNHVNTDIVSASSSEVATGWTFGGGIEAVLGNNWTGKTEYLYIDASQQNVFNSNLGTGATTFDNRFHVFRFGLNYQFATGKAPIVTRY